jgi:hypothetical protein
MSNIFNNKELDFNALSDEEKTFCIYASFNGGPGNTSKLLNKYKSMDNIISEFAAEQNPSHHEGQFPAWMKNVFGVVGGVELIKSYSPFLYEELGLEVGKSG